MKISLGQAHCPNSNYINTLNISRTFKTNMLVQYAIMLSEEKAMYTALKVTKSDTVTLDILHLQ